jgi:hypothetical protein
MHKDIENTLIRTEHALLWDDERARVAHETMILNVAEGGKQILDIPIRNAGIDLWNFQSYLVQGDKRASCFFIVDFFLANLLGISYLNVRPGQDIHIPISSRTPLSKEIKRMILAARKYNLKFTALSICDKIKFKMPIWKYPAMDKLQYQHACCRNAASCLRLNH